MRKFVGFAFILILVATNNLTAHAQSSAVDDMINTLATFAYAPAAGHPLQSPAETLKIRSGNCLEMAFVFAGELASKGFQTEIIGEGYTLPDGSTHKAPNDGHFFAVATDGKHAWANSAQAVKMFDTVDAAVASGGAGFALNSGLPAGAKAFNQVVLSGNYGEFMSQVNSGKINW